MPDVILRNQWKETVRENIRAGSRLDLAFLVMNILAATIASYGLFANSPAVVIGAMIVAMLLGPIAGVSLALVDGDTGLLLQSLSTLLAGTIAVMMTAFIIGLFHRDIPITNEIMSRTAPSLIDLMVALAGGAAGAYASVSPRLSVALVGVAIATALVPPLCSACILFAHGQMDLGLNALLLTFTNMVAIQFASSVVFWLTGFQRIASFTGLTLITFVRRNAVSICILLGLAVMLTTSLQATVARQLFETTTRFTLLQNIDASPGSHLAEVRFETVAGEDETRPGTTIVRAVVRGPQPPSPAQIAAMEAKLPSPPDGTAIELRIRFVMTSIINRDGPLFEDREFGMEK
jgi:uncharacterized hydrophobic protein (TIGR00271 family)